LVLLVERCDGFWASGKLSSIEKLTSRRHFSFSELDGSGSTRPQYVSNDVTANNQNTNSSSTLMGTTILSENDCFQMDTQTMRAREASRERQSWYSFHWGSLANTIQFESPYNRPRRGWRSEVAEGRLMSSGVFGSNSSPTLTWSVVWTLKLYGVSQCSQVKIISGLSLPWGFPYTHCLRIHLKTVIACQYCRAQCRRGIGVLKYFVHD